MLDLGPPTHFVVPAARPSKGATRDAVDPATLELVGRWADTTPE